MAEHGQAGLGVARQAWPGNERHGTARPGAGTARMGVAGKALRGWVGFGTDWLGKAGKPKERRLTNLQLHSMFAEWAGWVRSKRLYSPSPNPQSIIGTLVRLPSGREGNARLDPQLARLHAAIIGADEADHILIVCYYLRAQSHRKYRRGGVPVKTMAHALGVSRKTFYVRLLDARRRIWQRVEKHDAQQAEQGDKLALAVG